MDVTIRRAAATPNSGEQTHRHSRRSSQQEKRCGNNPRSGRSDGRSKEKGKDRPKRTASKPKLSKDEQERHKSEGLCFNCHQAGQFSRNCPDFNKVASSSKGSSPPGVTSFRMNIDYAAIEDQRESSRATRDDLSLGAVSFAGREDVQSEENDLPDLWSVSDIDSEVLTTLSDLGDMFGWDHISDAASEISCGDLNFPSIES